MKVQVAREVAKIAAKPILAAYEVVDGVVRDFELVPPRRALVSDRV